MENKFEQVKETIKTLRNLGITIEYKDLSLAIAYIAETTSVVNVLEIYISTELGEQIVEIPEKVSLVHMKEGDLPNSISAQVTLLTIDAILTKNDMDGYVLADEAPQSIEVREFDDAEEIKQISKDYMKTLKRDGLLKKKSLSQQKQIVDGLMRAGIL